MVEKRANDFHAYLNHDNRRTGRAVAAKQKRSAASDSIMETCAEQANAATVPITGRTKPRRSWSSSTTEYLSPVRACCSAGSRSNQNFALHWSETCSHLSI